MIYDFRKTIRDKFVDPSSVKIAKPKDLKPVNFDPPEVEFDDSDKRKDRKISIVGIVVTAIGIILSLLLSQRH